MDNQKKIQNVPLQIFLVFPFFMSHLWPLVCPMRMVYIFADFKMTILSVNFQPAGDC